ncbi:permease prefix domain 1-containing protein [Demequina gelatinilytica]|uniref:permease prefix domain 1-containing protein n=1 Tax=Demequina gelatinilytica TaxID=1638980 RepID=UPI00078333B9|nr:permease prefix domain 1-containing protein [Demequina gelatinilytica]
MNTDIHRLLDEAFADVAMTSDARDLKEEIRANLMARTVELESTGLAPSAAARRAIEELGPLEELLGTSPAAPSPEPMAAQHARHKVRPRPGFVVRTTLLSVVASAAAVLAIAAAAGGIDGGAGAVISLGLISAVALGIVTGDALAQETTVNHPMPRARATGWGVATFAAIAAVAAGGAFALDTGLVASAIAGGVLALASIGLFAWLGATQTNRGKAWVRAAAPAGEDHGFADDNAAARFGLYTAVLWTVGIAVAIALAVAVAWWWCLVILAACVAVMMLMIARMLFARGADE